MKNIRCKCAATVSALLFLASGAAAQNPIIQHTFTADPAPLVHGDTLYLYTGHDEDEAPKSHFIMYDYLCFSTTDMVNWTAHAPVADIRDLPYGGNANAAQAIYRNGKYYFYISPVGVIVLESESPYGPFKDALGRQLIHPDMTNYSAHGWEDIDPTVFIGDDGQAYMYWGNNALYCVKLNEDMVSFSGDIITFEIKDREAFGSDYEEAPWIFKRNGIYYLMYAAHVPEHIYYATSTSPLGPWKYGGVVMKAFEQGSMGNHPGVAEYKGQWYFFYMNEDLPEGHEKRRAVNIIPLIFNEDGSIPELKHSKAGRLEMSAPQRRNLRRGKIDAVHYYHPWPACGERVDVGVAAGRGDARVDDLAHRVDQFHVVGNHALGFFHVAREPLYVHFLVHISPPARIRSAGTRG